MATEKDGWAAFPSEDRDAEFSGMTLRDYYAGQALPSVVSVLGMSNGVVPEYVLRDLFGKDASGIRREQIAAALSYQLADAMLERRNRR